MKASSPSGFRLSSTRSLINEESNILLNAVNGTGNATFNGILQTSGTLTRAMGTDSPLDCLAKAYADVRVGAAFADPDLVLVHPNTLSALRRQKDADGRYILDLLAGPLNLTAYGQPSTGGPAGEPNKYSVIPQGVPGSTETFGGRRFRHNPGGRGHGCRGEHQSGSRYVLATPRAADHVRSVLAAQ